jgi:hypothetical protein
MGALSRTSKAGFLGLAATAAAAGLLSGCTSVAHGAAGAPPRTSSASTVTAPVVTTQAQLLPGFTPLVRASDRTGSAQLSELGHVAPGTVAVMVQCTGSGSLSVAITTIISFGVDCGGLPSYNEIHLGSSRSNVNVSVASDSSAHWALSLGWAAGGSTPQGASNSPS